MPAFALLQRIVGKRPRWRHPVFKFLERTTPLEDFRVVFDVGAHSGRMTAHYLQHLPNARIWSFEPAPASFERLRARFADESRVEVRPEALGSSQSTASMTVAGTSVMNRIVEHETAGAGNARLR